MLSRPPGSACTALTACTAAAPPMVARVTRVAIAALAPALVGALAVTPCAGRAQASTTSPAAPPATPAVTASSRLARLTLTGEFTHVGAGTVVRPAPWHSAVKSLAGTARYALVAPTDAPTGQALAFVPGVAVEAGWLRAVRSPATSQGVTLGVTFPLALGARLGHGATGPLARLRIVPGVAAAAGWSESQGRATLYDWTGVVGTPQAGQTGTAEREIVARSAMRGLGVQLAVEWDLAGVDRRLHGVALAASVRQWHFAGRAAAPQRDVSMAGLGLAIQPRRRPPAARRVEQPVQRSMQQPSREVTR